MKIIMEIEVDNKELDFSFHIKFLCHIVKMYK